MRMIQWFNSVAAGAVALACVMGVPAIATADAFPSKPIRMLVPFAAGGATDVAARLVGVEMGKILGQPVIVDNRPGGAGIVATDAVARSVPDGYTICFCTTGATVIMPHFQKLPYDPLKDLVPVSHVHNVENVFVARNGLGVKNLADVIALAKTKPGVLTFASSGLGGPHHFAIEWLQLETGTTFIHVPYQGEGPAMNATVGQQVDLLSVTVLLAEPQVKAGKIVLLAQQGQKRSVRFPDIPTVAEAGYPRFGWSNFVGVHAAAGTPQAIVNKLSEAIQKTMKMSAIIERFESMGLEPVGSTPSAYAALLKQESATWGRLVKQTNFKVD